LEGSHPQRVEESDCRLDHESDVQDPNHVLPADGHLQDEVIVGGEDNEVDPGGPVPVQEAGEFKAATTAIGLTIFAITEPDTALEASNVDVPGQPKRQRAS